jgi:proline iminopeptidase
MRYRKLSIGLSAGLAGAVALFCLARLNHRAIASRDPYALPADCPVRSGFTAVEGGKVWYEVIGHVGATPLLVLHGGPGFAHDYLEPIGRLCHQRPIIFYDQLGCGKSDRPKNPALWRIDRFVRELAQVREALGLKQVYILGQSWGTMLLTDYLLTKPKGVSGVIFSDPTLSIPRFVRDAARYRAQLPSDIQAVLDRHERLGSIACPEYQGAVVEYYRQHLCRLKPYPEPLERSFAGIGEEVYLMMNGPNEFTISGTIKSYDRTSRLAEIKSPTLFICGRYDEASPEATEIYHRALPGSEMVIFEKSSHTPFLEETDRYLEVLSDFLRRIETARQ